MSQWFFFSFACANFISTAATLGTSFTTTPKTTIGISFILCLQRTYKRFVEVSTPPYLSVKALRTRLVSTFFITSTTYLSGGMQSAPLPWSLLSSQRHLLISQRNLSSASSLMAQVLLVRAGVTGRVMHTLSLLGYYLTSLHPHEKLNPFVWIGPYGSG